MIPTPKELLDLQARAAAIVTEKWPFADPKNSCPLFAAVTVWLIQQAGQRAILQAGSAHWPRRRCPDDIKYFGYEWCGPRPPHLGLAEVHCWAAVPASQQIIDLSTSWQPEQCQKLLGMSCQPMEPLSCFGPEELAELDYTYRAEMDAIVYIVTRLIDYGVLMDSRGGILLPKQPMLEPPTTVVYVIQEGGCNRADVPTLPRSQEVHSGVPGLSEAGSCKHNPSE